MDETLQKDQQQAEQQKIVEETKTKDLFVNMHDELAQKTMEKSAEETMKEQTQKDKLNQEYAKVFGELVVIEAKLKDMWYITSPSAKPKLRKERTRKRNYLAKLRSDGANGIDYIPGERKADRFTKKAHEELLKNDFEERLYDKAVTLDAVKTEHKKNYPDGGYLEQIDKRPILTEKDFERAKESLADPKLDMKTIKEPNLFNAVLIQAPEDRLEELFKNMAAEQWRDVSDKAVNRLKPEQLGNIDFSMLQQLAPMTCFGLSAESAQAVELSRQRKLSQIKLDVDSFDEKHQKAQEAGLKRLNRYNSPEFDETQKIRSLTSETKKFKSQFIVDKKALETIAKEKVEADRQIAEQNRQINALWAENEKVTRIHYYNISDMNNITARKEILTPELTKKLDQMKKLVSDRAKNKSMADQLKKSLEDERARYRAQKDLPIYEDWKRVGDDSKQVFTSRLFYLYTNNTTDAQKLIAKEEKDLVDDAKKQDVREKQIKKAEDQRKELEEKLKDVKEEIDDRNKEKEEDILKRGKKLSDNYFKSMNFGKEFVKSLNALLKVKVPKTSGDLDKIKDKVDQAIAATQNIIRPLEGEEKKEGSAQLNFQFVISLMSLLGGFNTKLSMPSQNFAGFTSDYLEQITLLSQQHFEQLNHAEVSEKIKTKDALQENLTSKAAECSNLQKDQKSGAEDISKRKEALKNEKKKVKDYADFRPIYEKSHWTPSDFPGCLEGLKIPEGVKNDLLQMFDTFKKDEETKNENQKKNKEIEDNIDRIKNEFNFYDGRVIAADNGQQPLYDELAAALLQAEREYCNTLHANTAKIVNQHEAVSAKISKKLQDHEDEIKKKNDNKEFPTEKELDKYNVISKQLKEHKARLKDLTDKEKQERDQVMDPHLKERSEITNKAEFVQSEGCKNALKEKKDLLSSFARETNKENFTESLVNDKSISSLEDFVVKYCPAIKQGLRTGTGDLGWHSLETKHAYPISDVLNFYNKDCECLSLNKDDENTMPTDETYKDLEKALRTSIDFDQFEPFKDTNLPAMDTKVNLKDRVAKAKNRWGDMDINKIQESLEGTATYDSPSPAMFSKRIDLMMDASKNLKSELFRLHKLDTVYSQAQKTQKDQGKPDAKLAEIMEAISHGIRAINYEMSKYDKQRPHMIDKSRAGLAAMNVYEAANILNFYSKRLAYQEIVQERKAKDPNFKPESWRERVKAMDKKGNPTSTAQDTLDKEFAKV